MSDPVAVALSVAALDLTYLRARAERLSVADLLARAETAVGRA